MLESFEGSRYFLRHAPITTRPNWMPACRAEKLALALEIPSGFGRDLVRGRNPEVGVWVDGAMPFRAETIRGLCDRPCPILCGGRDPAPAGARGGAYPSPSRRATATTAFRSANAIVPSVIMLMLVLIPAITTALGIVKEKETGSIANFQSTP